MKEVNIYRQELDYSANESYNHYVQTFYSVAKTKK